MARRNYIPEEIRQKLLNRIPPHNEQAEQAVLGSALISADCIPDLINTLDPEDFIFRRIKSSLKQS